MARMPCALALLLCAVVLAGGDASRDDSAPRRIQVLFLGDRGHHEPARRAQDIYPALTARGIDLTYTNDIATLAPDRLARFDCVLIYANHTEITPAQEAALVECVAGGKGLVAVHCASACFPASERYRALVGGQFARHGEGIVHTEIVRAEHPAIKELPALESWDETYVHKRLTDDRVVLAERVDGAGREPWPWVREQGKGRVLYTAWGHDRRTWSQPAFHALIERGIRWAAGDWALDLEGESAGEPFAYEQERLPPDTPPRAAEASRAQL